MSPEVQQALLKITLVIFMVGNLLDMGLRLQFAEAIQDLRDVRFVAWSLLWGFLLLPGLAYAMGRFIPMEHPYVIGLVLLAMTPCAPFLPPMVDRARGNLGYTAAFMLLVCVVTVAYMPLAVPLLVQGLSASAWTIAKPLLFFLLLPLAAGLWVQRRSASFAARIEPLVKTVTGIDTILLLVLCLTLYGKELLALQGSHAIGAQLLFFAVAAVAPYLLTFGVPREQKIVISLGMTTRNLGAAFAPLYSTPGIDQRAIVMVALGMIMQTTFSFGAATFYRRLTQAGRT
jgi:bile acid:Na+ symporter, BASS family